MNRLKIAFTLLIIAALAVIGYRIYDNIGLIAEKDVVQDLLHPKAELSLKSAHFIEMSGAKKVLEVYADEAYSLKDNNSAELLNPRAVFYGKDDRKVYFKGDRGIINTQTNDVNIEGHVVMDSPEGYHLETSYLKYLSDGMIVTTDSPVRITSDLFDIKGAGLTSDVEGETFIILNNVEAVLFLSVGGSPFAEVDKIE